jgi:pimeloyl-ACP methyl ester carboxylesterase
MQVTANGITIEVEQNGPADGPPLLLIMGLGMQLTAWPDDFVAALAGAGFRVIRFDNRDIGLSTKFDAAGSPNLLRASWRYFFRLPVASAYKLDDMAADTIGVLDALGIAQCHVVGASMGGMIAQIVAAKHPERVRSLTLIMTTSGARNLPGPTMKARSVLLSRPTNPRDPQSVLAHSEHILKIIGSPGFPTDPVLQRERLTRNLKRSYHPQGMARQLLAVVASGDRKSLLDRISAPTLVLHGRADPLVPVASGIDLAARIQGAKLELIDGMGHDLPPGLTKRLTDSIAAHSR